MNKILTLYNIEFKRIYKLYFSLIGVLFIGNLAGVIKSIYDSVKYISMQNNLVMNIKLLSTNLGQNFVNNFMKDDILFYGNIALVITVLICLIYAAIIWYRDYFLNSKTIYTLLSLPQPRFNIYISKLLVSISMIYGVIASQLLFWYIDLNIVKIISGIKFVDFTNVYKMLQKANCLNLVSPYMLDFLMIDLFGVILAIIVIFTGVLIERSIKKVGVILGTLYVLFSIFGYFFIASVYISFWDCLIFKHVIYYILLFIISIFISYHLINKKVYV